MVNRVHCRCEGEYGGTGKMSLDAMTRRPLVTRIGAVLVAWRPASRFEWLRGEVARKAEAVSREALEELSWEGKETGRPPHRNQPAG